MILIKDIDIFRSVDFNYCNVVRITTSDNYTKNYHFFNSFPTIDSILDKIFKENTQEVLYLGKYKDYLYNGIELKITTHPIKVQLEWKL